MKPKTRYMFDCEFMEDGRDIELLSIGIVCQDGREYYAENAEADWSKANEWVQQNVLPLLHYAPTIESISGLMNWENPDKLMPDLTHFEVKARKVIAHDIEEFVRAGAHMPEWWAYFADYDWIVMCQLFGRMIDLPRSWPQFCLDINQEAYKRGISRLKEVVPQEGVEHNALADARWNWKAWQWLQLSE